MATNISLLTTLLLAFIVGGSFTQEAAAPKQPSLHCMKNEINNIPKDWITVPVSCTDALHKQIKKEFEAAYTYVTLGEYFGRDEVNKPGFSKFFMEAASEEREHAISLMSYLAMRGHMTGKIAGMIPGPKTGTILNSAKTSISGTEALVEALKLETAVTNNIREVIKTCESGENDYHTVDFLTGEFLTEQYHGQRDIAGKLSTLKKMSISHGALAEFLFDKKLLE